MKKITLVVFLMYMSLFNYQLSAQVISEDFESGLGTYENAAGNNVDWVVNTTLFQSGVQSISNAYAGSNDNAVFLTTPVDLTGVTNPQLSFWHIAKTEGGNDNANVEISTDGGTTWNAFLGEDYLGEGVLESPGVFSEDSYPIWETTAVTPTNAWWKREFFDLSDYMTDSVVIRFRLDSDSSLSRAGWFLDDVEIIEVTCPMPSAIVANNIGPNSADITWTAGATETEWEILYGLAGFDPETEGTSVIDNDGTLGETITSLTAVEEYDIYIKAICSTSEESVWVGPYSFNTACDVISLPWSEDFASDTTPLCWEETGDNAWYYSLNGDYAASSIGDHTPGGGTNYAWMDGSNNGNGEVSSLTSPLIDVSTLTEPALEFFLFSDNVDSPAINLIDVEFFDGANWNSVLNVSALLGSSWSQYVIDLAPYTITGAVQVRFTITGDESAGGSAYHNDVLLDDVTFIEMPDCANPIASYEVVGNCMVGPEFFVDVDLTNMSGTDDIIISDNQTPVQTETATATGVYQFGPYPNGTDVVISLENTVDAGCSATSSSLTQEYCTETYLDCAVDGPFNVVYCYDSGEVYEITYISTDGTTPLNLNVNSGNVENNYDEFIILDSDGTTQLYNGTGNGGDLSGLTFQSTGDNITVRLISNGFTSCESNDYTPIDITVACATCVNPQATYFKDCDPANQEYSIDVEITDLGSAGSVEITDDQGSAPQTLTTVGIVSFGPYAYDTDVVITTENLDDPNCVINIINSDACPPIPCIEAEPFCSDEGLLFPNVDNSTGTTAPPGIDYGCLFSQPNPVWYFLQIQDPGDLSIEMVQNTSFDDNGNPNGTGLDVDFIAWGPFNDVDSACNGLTVQNQVPDSAAGDGCSYSAAPEETFGIENAQEGEVYVLLITNYSGQPGFITLNQTGGDGSTDCSIIDENTTYACGDDPVTLTSQYPTALAYVWYMQDANGDFNVIDGEDTMDLTVAEEGIYRLDTFNNAGELQQEIFTVIYSEGPDLSNVDDTVSFCGSTSTTLDATIANPGAFDGVTYQWSDENGPLTGETQATLTVTQAGFYTIDVSGVVLDDDGNATSQTCDSSITIEVTTADFTVDAGADQSACDAEEVSLIAAVAGADTANATYDWVNSSGDSVGSTETITVTQADVYTVTITIDGCVASDDVEVIFNNTPSIDLGGDISTCDVGGVTIDATPAMGVGGVTFEWTYNGTSIPETGAIVNAVDYGFGTYTVEAYSDAACAASHSITISEADYTVNLSADQELVATVLNYCEGEESVPSYSITFTANIDGIDASLLSYAWYKNGSLISDAADEPTYTANYTEDVAAMDTYSVEVSLDSCVVNSEALGVDLTIAPYEGGCVISEGLSPGNLDGMNDCLDLSFLSDRTGIKNIQIFSRYGRVVYEKSNYVNDWCGQDKDGDVLQTATYFYVIEFTSPDPVYGKVKKGWIYLNRESNN
ncbi:gliding motility-associated C-terminal domain-containing protein [Mesonia sp.]|uniref:T9SS type B sorting domain-containing protein n=1 Tax=Mesonia sp. TaxID=1960830 RepID=UPI003F989610